MLSAFRAYLPRGNTLSDETWNKRHLLLQWLLFLHVPALFIFGVARGYPVQDVAATVAVPFALLLVARIMHTRRLASFFVTAGLSYCSAALVGLSGGAIEAHFHFFIIVGFIALYQDWVPFAWNIVFTVFSHGLGSAFNSTLIFNHSSAVANPWAWSVLHGAAVLAASVGVLIFWRQTEDEQIAAQTLQRELADTELSRRKFTSELLVNLARRNQNLLYRQLELLNQLEEHERDPDALSDLFTLDHLATRIRRNAESLLVLSGEEPARKWGRPVSLADVVRASIAETEDLDRVDFAIDESLYVSGRAVSDLTHLLAEMIENAVHFSPPSITVMLRTRIYLQSPGAHVLTIEDWGVGMSPEEMGEANDLLAMPRDVDLSQSQRLGLHVVSRLAQRYGITVTLTPTPGGGVTAVVMLPAELFERSGDEGAYAPSQRVPAMSGSAPMPPAGLATGLAPGDFGRELGRPGGLDPEMTTPAGLTGPPAGLTGLAGAPSAPPPPAAAPAPVAPPLAPPISAEPPAYAPLPSRPTGLHTPSGQPFAPDTAAPFSVPSDGTADGSDNWHSWWGSDAGAPDASGPRLPADVIPSRDLGAPPPARREPRDFGTSRQGDLNDLNGPLSPRDPADAPTDLTGRPGTDIPRRGPGGDLPGRPGIDLPRREPGGDLPRREPGGDLTGRPGTDLPRREPANDLQRSEAGGDLPRRQPGASPAADLPRREPGASALTDLPRREPGTGASPDLSRREPALGDYARREPPADLPRREPVSDLRRAAEPDGNGLPRREPGDGTALPVSDLAARSAAPDQPASGGLSRRVPRANLAEGLRRDAEPVAEQPATPIRDPDQAREALSRFQANQRAARAMLDGATDDGTGSPGSGGQS
jgi:signal transduction histidine kinase